jgi:integrase/recombinase XerD
MKPNGSIATLIERYFTERLMRQRNVSANTIASYRDTFRLLFTFAQARLRKPPSALALDDLDVPFISAFSLILRPSGAPAPGRATCA